MEYHEKFKSMSEKDIILFETFTECQLMNVIYFLIKHGYSLKDRICIINSWRNTESKYIAIYKNGDISFEKENVLEKFKIIEYHSFKKEPIKI